MRLFALSVLYVLIVWSEAGFGGVSGAEPAVSTDRAAEPMRMVLGTDKSGGAAKRDLWARVATSTGRFRKFIALLPEPVSINGVSLTWPGEVMASLVPSKLIRA